VFTGREETGISWVPVPDVDGTLFKKIGFDPLPDFFTAS
jgi:hypothetical protein